MITIDPKLFFYFERADVTELKPLHHQLPWPAVPTQSPPCNPDHRLALKVLRRKKNTLNSPAFESLKLLPRMGLPHYSFIILQPFQTRSDTVWVIINHCERSVPAQLRSACSSLADKTFKTKCAVTLISVEYVVVE